MKRFLRRIRIISFRLGSRAEDFLLYMADEHPGARILSYDRYTDHVKRYPWIRSSDRLIPGMIRSVEGPNLDRSGPPYVVQGDRMVPHRIVVGGIRIGIFEPCLVEFFPGGELGVFQAGDESALGALGVVPKTEFPRTTARQNKAKGMIS